MSLNQAEAFARPTHLQFDYRLIQGAPKSTNAIRILEFLGFPDGIIRDASMIALFWPYFQRRPNLACSAPSRTTTSGSPFGRPIDGYTGRGGRFRRSGG